MAGGVLHARAQSSFRAHLFLVGHAGGSLLAPPFGDSNVSRDDNGAGKKIFQILNTIALYGLFGNVPLKASAIADRT